MKNATTKAYAASLIVSTTQSRLIGFSGHNSSASAQFIQLHDSPALPAEGSVPKIIIKVAADTSFGIDYGDDGDEARFFANGIVVCNSSTGPTKTIGSADCWFDVQYR